MTDASPVTPLRRKLKAGTPTFGYVVSIPSPANVQIMARSGADWLLIDMEHSPITMADAQTMMAVMAGTDCAPVIRVPSESSAQIKQALDCGAHGIVFPMINDAEKARTTVEALRYPPKGKRGFGPLFAPMQWQLSPADYLARADDEIINWVLVETAAGVDNLDDILAVPGLDIVALARGDLSSDLGVPGQMDHPKVNALVEQAEHKIKAAGVTLSGVATSPEDARAMAARGYKVIVMGLDIGLLQGGMTAALSTARGCSR